MAGRIEVELMEGLDDEDWYSTLFPDVCSLEHSIVGKVKDKGLLEINYHNFRENAGSVGLRRWRTIRWRTRHKFKLRAQPIFDTFDKLNVTKPRVILLDPAGRTLIRPMQKNWRKKRNWSLICGQFTGLWWAHQNFGDRRDFLGRLCPDWGRAGCYDYCRCHCPFDSWGFR